MHYLIGQASYGEILGHLCARLGPVHAVCAAERELRNEVATLEAAGHLLMHEHPGWLTPRSWFVDSVGTEPPFRMDAFYRKVRQSTGWLMENGKPMGGKYSFDAENRFPWKGDPPAPDAPVFACDEIDTEVESLVRTHYGHHPGSVDLSMQPTSADDVAGALAFAVDCLPNFGTYEDAMSEQSRGLFHSRLATLVNLSLIHI